MADPITDPTYRYATERYDLDGSTIDFYFNFSDDYIDRSYVKAYYERLIDFSTVEIDPLLIEFVGVGHLRIPDAATKDPSLFRLMIKRWTEKEEPLVRFNDDSLITGANLFKSVRQPDHNIMEMIDYLADLNAKWEKLNENVLNILETVQQLLEQIQVLLDGIEDRLTALENMKYTDLKDTPNALVANGIPQVNPAGTALVWKTANEIVQEAGVVTRNNFTDLIDTPDSYEDQLNKVLTVGASGIVFKTIEDAVTEGGANFVGEAPEDTKLYGRKDGAWSEVVIPEPPVIDNQGQLVMSYAGKLNAVGVMCAFVATKEINVLSGKYWLGTAATTGATVSVYVNNVLLHDIALTTSGVNNQSVTKNIVVGDLVEMRLSVPDATAENFSLTYLYEK